jgi:hypothetical protein
MINTPSNSIIFTEGSLNDATEVIRLDKEGFHYRGQFIEDAGEAHRLMLEYLRTHTVQHDTTNDLPA